MEWSLKTGIGKTGVVLAAMAALAMCVLSLLFHPVDIMPVEYGLCLPSPDSWEFDPLWSWGINTVLIGLISLLTYLINKSYNFIRTTEPVFQTLILVMAASSPWLTQAVNISVLLCLANLVGLGIIFGAYNATNATQQLFILGVMVGIGSMFQYAFLPMAIVYILWALFMKVLRIKETLAFIAGIICPFWITLGIGWLKISDFHFPSLTPLFSLTGDISEFFILLIGIALAAAIGFIVTCVNSMKLYAGNSMVNAMNLCISTLGAVCVICIVVDYDNIIAYITSLYLACALQLGNICALWNPKMPWIVTALPAACYIGIFVCSIIFR